MKRTPLWIYLLVICLLSGCSVKQTPAQVAATTLPVYEFTAAICEDTPISVARLVTEEVSCLHDYSLNVRQVKAAESAEVIVISGAGLEEFLDDILIGADAIDASEGIALIETEENSHDHDSHDHEEAQDDENHEGHHHDLDPHIWLSPVNAMTMAKNIYHGLCGRYPQYTDTFSANLETLLEQFQTLQSYGASALADLSCREMITFHDGFAYFAEAFDLTILRAVEEESGSEASAKELITLIEEVEHHQLPAIFTEVSGSVSAAGIISRETGAKSFALDMAMAGDSYFDAMYYNIDTIKEALQ